jgi:hypothetical protein
MGLASLFVSKNVNWIIGLAFPSSILRLRIFGKKRCASKASAGCWPTCMPFVPSTPPGEHVHMFFGTIVNAVGVRATPKTLPNRETHSSME